MSKKSNLKLLISLLRQYFVLTPSLTMGVLIA